MQDMFAMENIIYPTAKDTIFWNTAITVEPAANAMNTKNRTVYAAMPAFGTFLLYSSQYPIYKSVTAKQSHCTGVVLP